MDNFTDIVLDYITDGDVPENFTDTVRDYLEAMFEGVEGLILDDLNVTVNGTYIPASGHAYRRVDVDVESPSIDLISLNVTENGEYTPPVGKAYNSVVAAVPNTYLASDEGKVVSGGSLVSQTPHATVTENGTIDTTLNNSVTIDVPSGASLPSVISNIDGGEFTFASERDTTYRINHTLGVTPKGFVIWTDDVDLSTTGNYRCIRGVFIVNESADGSTTSYLYQLGTNNNHNFGAYSRLVGADYSGYANSNYISYNVSNSIYVAGATYKWFAWV